VKAKSNVTGIFSPEILENCHVTEKGIIGGLVWIEVFMDYLIR